MGRSHGGVVPALLALLMMAAACGGTAHAAPTPIKIGSLVPVSTLAAGQWVAAMKAAAREINGRGGIHGRPLEIENCDDHRDPNQAQACARKLVNDRVIATAGSLTTLSMVEAPILDEAGIAQVGGEALNPEDTSLPTAFPLDGGIVTQVIGDVLGIKARGLHSLFVVTLDTPSGQLAAALASQAARAVGIQMLGATYAPQAAGDFTTYVQAAEQAHPDVVWPALLEPWLGQFLAASKKVGAKYVVTAAYGAWSPKDITELGGASSPTEGSIEFGPVPPVTATAQFAGLRTFKSDLDAEWAAGDKDAAPDLRSGGPLMAWVGVEAIAKIASTLRSVDSGSLLKALQTSPQVDTMGLTPPWTPGRTGPPAFPRVTNPFGYLITQHDGVQTLAAPQPINISAGLAG